MRCILTEQQQGVLYMSTEKKNNYFSTRNLVQLALLTAIIVVMAFTPIGYLKTPVVEITFLTIPVIIGAIIIGPLAGAFLGAVFGFTSFIQCFGMSIFGGTLLAISPLFTFLLCIIPRVLMGFLCGVFFNAIYRADKSSSKLVAFSFASLSGSLLNTILFVLFVFVFFGHSDYILSFGNTTFEIIAVLVGINGIVEAVVCTIIATAVCKALVKIFSTLAKREKTTKISKKKSKK